MPIVVDQTSKIDKQIDKIVTYAKCPLTSFNELLLLIDNSIKLVIQGKDKKPCNIVKAYAMKDGKKIEDIELDENEYLVYYVPTGDKWNTDIVQVQVFLDKPKTAYMSKMIYVKRMFKLNETVQNKKQIEALKIKSKEITANNINKDFGVFEDEAI